MQDPATTIVNGYRRNMVNSGLTVGYQMPRLLFTSTTSYQFLQDRMKMDQDYMTPDFLQLAAAEAECHYPGVCAA